MNAKDAWRATLGQLQVQLNRATYDTWLRHADLLGYEDGRFVVTVPNAYAKDWIDRHLLPAMTETLSRIFRRDSEIQIIVWNPIDDEVIDFVQPDNPLDAESSVPLEPDARHGLNSEYTFDRFVIGDANRYAALLGRAITDSAIGKYSPVLFHGGMGMGKTHLLQAITRELILQGHQAIYLTAEDFSNQLFAAIRNQDTIAFREKYRQVDALLIDDLQFVEGKESVQNELVAIWDTLRNHKKTIIFSSNRLPRDMVKVSKDARSRFQAGPIASIDPPDFALRLALVEAKSQQRKLPISAEVCTFLAEQIDTNIRDLESAIEQLDTYAQITQQTITLTTTTKILNMLGSGVNTDTDNGSPVGRYSKTGSGQRGISLEKVIDATARHYGLHIDDLASRKRTKSVVQARQLAMYLARELTEASLPQIGEILGGRDHSTILHGCARITAQLSTDAVLSQDLAAIQETLLHTGIEAPIERGTEQSSAFPGTLTQKIGRVPHSLPK